MAGLRFPFWIVTQRRGRTSTPVELDEMPGFVVAFSTAEMAASFMVSRGEPEWENRLVVRSTLADLLADLRKLGVRGVCLDPGKNRSGEKLAFEELGIGSF